MASTLNLQSVATYALKIAPTTAQSKGAVKFDFPVCTPGLSSSLDLAFFSFSCFAMMTFILAQSHPLSLSFSGSLSSLYGVEKEMEGGVREGGIMTECNPLLTFWGNLSLVIFSNLYFASSSTLSPPPLSSLVVLAIMSRCEGEGGEDEV